jgi:hypothetical protein
MQRARGRTANVCQMFRPSSAAVAASEKANACQNEAGKASTGDGTGAGAGLTNFDISHLGAS